MMGNSGSARGSRMVSTAGRPQLTAATFLVRSPWLQLAALPLALIAAAAALKLPPALALAAPLGLAGAAAMALYPFAGLIVLVAASQLGGLLVRWGGPFGEIAIEGIAVCVLLGVLINGFRTPRHERWATTGMKGALLFAAALLLAWSFAANPEYANRGLQKMFSVLLLFFLVVQLVRTEKQVAAVLWAIVLSTALSGGISVANQAAGRNVLGTVDQGSTRMTGASAAAPTAASRPLLAGAAVAMLLAVRAGRRRLYAGCAAFGLAGVFLTLSRSTGMVALIAVGWLMIKMWRHPRFPLVVVGFLLVGLAGLALAPEALTERMSTVGEMNEDWTAARRVGYHVIGIDLLKRHPVFGVGPDNFGPHYVAFDYRFAPGRRLASRALHNMYLSIAVETGLFGFACFAGMLGAALWGVHCARRDGPTPTLRMNSEAIQFALVVFLLTATFGAAETTKYLWILLGLSAVVARLASRPATDSIRH